MIDYLDSLQLRSHSCGPVALYNLLQFKKKKVKREHLNHLEKLCHEHNGWTYTSGITKALNKLSKKYKFNYQYISKAKAPQAIEHLEKGKPLILLHFDNGEGHYVFIENFKENGIKKLNKMAIRRMMSRLKNTQGVPELWLIS